MIFRQLFDSESSTYTYILADEASREAVVIDSVLEQVDRDSKLLEELGVRPKYYVETHVHADHITGASRLRDRFGGEVVLGQLSQVEAADRLLADGETISFGAHSLMALATPGHTSGCTCFAGDGRVFTGDVLFIRGCGRTDFQGGSAERLYKSVHEKLYSLSDETLVYPGHDYRGLSVTTIGEEKSHNPRLNQSISQDQFAEIMNGLNLAHPKKIREAVPANLKLGAV